MLAALARLQNRSAASLVREMIDSATPLMTRTVELLSIAEDARGLSRQAARDALKSVLDELQAITGDPNQLDLLKLLPDLPDGSEGAGAMRSEATSTTAPSPPSSNTGVSYAGPTGPEASL